MEKKMGIIDSDLISLIKYAKAKDKKTVICNSLGMVGNNMFEDVWFKFKLVNKELYWEYQYLYQNDPKIIKYQKKQVWRYIKKFKFQMAIQKLIIYLMWEYIVDYYYHIYVKIPYQIRNLNEKSNF